MIFVVIRLHDLNMKNYFIPIELVDWQKVQAEWNWLVPPKSSLVLVTLFGDLFLETDDGTIMLLDLEDGTIEPYSRSIEELKNQLYEDPNIDELLYIPLVDELVNHGIKLNNSDCYHFIQPTVLGGEFKIENVATINVSERIAFCGDIQKQIANLPVGAQVEIKWME